MIPAAWAALVGALSRNACSRWRSSERIAASGSLSTGRPLATSLARTRATSSAVRSSTSPRPRILAELATMEVPMWPGMTTATRTCGACRRRSVISASVKPFTANFAAL